MNPSSRVSALVAHLSPSSSDTSASSTLSSSSTASSTTKRPDDIVIVSALRTAIGKARKGWFRDSFPEDMLAHVIKATLERTKVKADSLGDIVVGSVLGVGSQRANECRQGAFLAGVPDSVPLHVTNRQCSSGLQAIAEVAASIKAGYYTMGLACGLEHMSSGGIPGSAKVNPRVFLNQQAKDCLIPMGITSENVATDFGVSRREQDEFSVGSHKKASAAQKAGKLKGQIVPMKVRVKDEKTGETNEILADHDDGVRGETNIEGLQKLNAAFQQGGSTTAGNSSQVSDGAAAVLVTTRANAKALGLPVLAKFVSFAVSGVPPRVMGIGPAFAIPEALKMAGITKDDVDVYEINEAFASQAVYCVKKLGIDANKVNPNGGAVAIGHPLGATGARMTADLLPELKRRNGKYGVVSMCIGSGMGAAAVFENEQ